MNRVTTALRTVSLGILSMASKAGGNIMMVSGYLAHMVWLIPTQLAEIILKGYGGNSAVYACIRLLADSVPEPPCVPHAVDQQGKPEQVLDYSHPFRKLLRRPNQFFTEVTFWELTTIFTATVGVSYWWKERNNLNKPMAYWPLRPDRVGPIYANQQDQDNGARVIIGWSYLPPGMLRPIELDVNDVLIFHRPNPIGASGGVVEGFGPMQGVLPEIAVDTKATEFVGALISNHATPGLIIKTKSRFTKQSEASLIKAAFMQEFGGTRRGEPAVLDSNSDIMQVGFNLQQLEFPSLRKLGESRIAAAFGTPAILVGLSVGLEAGIRATMEETRKLFAETTCASYWRRFAAVMTEEARLEFGQSGTNIVCAFDLTKVRSLVNAFDAELVKFRDAYERGAITTDEYRLKLGLDPLPNGAGEFLARNIAPGGGQQTFVPADTPPGEVARLSLDDEPESDVPSSPPADIPAAKPAP